MPKLFNLINFNFEISGKSALFADQIKAIEKLQEKIKKS